ncbi:MAG: fibronectin type III domain-containing protein, partial [Thermoguttaceae bacterium]|nr:fibronectin type III domain-containing protein [Thermoguttaceae bacterium]
GGFSVDNANATFTNVDVIGCHADVRGGGIYIESNVEAPGQGKSTLTNVRILDNASDDGESSGLGGGLYATANFMGGEIEMTNVEISGNQARVDGGGVFLNDITSTLTNVKITDNNAQGNGGAFYANAPDHTFISNLTGYPLLLISTKLTNVEITGNKAYNGFGFYADEFDVEELSLRNVTLADNVGTQDGASADVYLANGVATFYNSIVDGDVQGEEYAANAYNTLSSFTDWANATDDGVVNYEIDATKPLFADAANDDYALAENSQAINKGSDAYVPETLTTDLAGNNRFNGTVDAGAYEDDGALPLAPTGLSATFDETTKSATLTWFDNATNETGYVVEEYVADAWTSVATLAADATTWTSAALHVDGIYVYRVVAVNVYGRAASDSAEVKAVGTAPAAPDAIVFGAHDPETGKLEMSWGNVEGETRYRVEASLDGENWWVSQSLDADVTERVATLSYKNTPYFFRVRAENAAGVSEWTTAKFTPAPTQPGAIKFTAYDATTRKLDMSWGNSLNETKYRVEASLDGENWWFSQSLDVDVTNRVATLSYNDRPYFFRVRAENATGVSEWTVAQFDPQLSAPKTLEFGAYDAATGKLEMTWNDVAGETSYRVEASLDGENWWFSQNTSTDVTARVATLSYNDRPYFFRVRAENDSGVSEWTTAKFTPP